MDYQIWTSQVKYLSYYLAFDINLNLLRVNCRNFSISFDESHLFNIPKYNLNTSSSRKLDRLNSTMISINKDHILSSQSFSKLEQKNSLISGAPKKSVDCCSWLCNCIKKKEKF